MVSKREEYSNFGRPRVNRWWTSTLNKMSMKKSRRPPLNFSLTSSSNGDHSPNHSDQEDDDMSSSSDYQSRPLSVTIPNNIRRPTLAEVLSNTAPPPYTLSAFMAYLSQNHCLETLEFTMDASRYRKHFQSMTASANGSTQPSSESCQYVKMLWQRLMDAYIQQNGPREVNLPSGVRDALLSIPNTYTPPPPESLDPAVNIIYELMEESVLLPFLNSVSYQATPQYPPPWDKEQEDMYLRGSLDERMLHQQRRGGSASPPPLEYVSSSYSSATSNSGSSNASYHPRGSSHPFSPSLGWHRHSGHAAPNTWSGNENMIEEDVPSPSSHGTPMTPPTTPPSCESVGSSPRSKTDKTWKRMTGKLSWPKSRRSHHPGHPGLQIAGGQQHDNYLS